MQKPERKPMLSTLHKGGIFTDTRTPGTELEGARNLPLNLIDPNPRNARKNYEDRPEMADLTESIREQGVIQPIVVRKIGEKYTVVAGDRRRLASIRAGKETIPAIVVELSDQEADKVSLLENIQRSNLTPVEEADAYHAFMKEMGMSIRELATYLNKSRGAIENLLAPAKMPPEYREVIEQRPESVSALQRIASVPDPIIAGELLRGVLAGDTFKDTTNKIKEKVSLRKDTRPAKAYRDRVFILNDQAHNLKAILDNWLEIDLDVLSYDERETLVTSSQATIIKLKELLERLGSKAIE